MTNLPTLPNQPTHLSDAERIVSTRYAAGAARTVVIIALGWHLANDLPATLASGPDPLCLTVWLAFTAVGVAGSIAVLKGVVIGPAWRIAGCAGGRFLMPVLFGELLSGFSGSYFGPDFLVAKS